MAFWVVAAVPADAQDAPGLAPSVPWTLDYDADSCALRRMFGEGEDRAYLEMRRFGPGLGLQTSLGSKKMITDLAAGQEARRQAGETIGKMHHFTMNPWLEFTGPDTARFHYYHQTVFGTGGALNSPTAPRMAAAGQGVDDLVKIDGKWYIKYRNVAPTREQE